MAEIKLVENCSEIGAGTRGAGLGIGALQVVARQRENDFFGRYERFLVNHQNELLDEKETYAFAKRIDGLAEVYQSTGDILGHIFEQGDFPVLLSGDHSCAAGTLMAIKKAHPTQRIGVIWIDAHADLHTPYTTPSGNIHGMPLAMTLAEDNLPDAINEPAEDVVEMWNKLKNMGKEGPKFKTEDLVFISVRDTEDPEDNFIERNKIKNYKVEEVRRRGLETIANEVQERLAECDLVYVSFDVDSMDCILVSKGTGTPVENGLSPEEATYFMNTFAGWNKTKCVEIVEINPCLDNKVNKMAEVAFDILTSSTEQIEKRI